MNMKVEIEIEIKMFSQNTLKLTILEEKSIFCIIVKMGGFGINESNVFKCI